MSAKKFIDIEHIIGAKNPRLLKWMPGFILRYIKRILHEDEVNAFMKQHGHLRDFEFISEVLKYFNIELVVKGQENIPLEGGFILAANHPLGGLDGLALMQAVSTRRTDIRFLVNDILLFLKTMDNLFVPVNKHGSQHAVSKIEEAYASDNAVLIFPAGLVSRKQNGKVEDLDWKKSFISKSIRYNKNVVPCYIDGANTSFFYNIAMWRKRFGIKANIEMFYLADEMFKQRNKTITIIFDQPVNPETFTKAHTHAHWAQSIRSHVYDLKKKVRN